MGYKWINDQKLEDLKGWGKDGILYFSTKNEKVEVYLKDNDINKIVYSYNNNQIIINKKDRHHIVVGEGNAKRDVFHYLKPNGPAPEMRLGITKHIGSGTWSSLPHDFELNTEPGFEEIFFYILKGGTQKGIQRGDGVWVDNTNINSCWSIEDETFGMVPMGYHPVVGEPSVTVSYIWIYLCKKPEWEKI